MTCERKIMERHNKTGNKNLSTKDIAAAFAYFYGYISKSEYLDLVDLLDAKRKKIRDNAMYN